MNNDIVLYANGKAYHTVNGVILTEEFSETLDSMNIVLDNVSKEDRLNVKPYDFVRIKNVGEGFTLDKEMLIDSIVETETNIAQHIYQYSIALMSETKLLEKIQCPNLAITHSLRFGKKKIAKKLDEYCNLYVPYVKMLGSDSKWDYKRLLSWDTLTNDKKFNDEDCADLAMQMPTMRQLLTNIMLQNGRIPNVSERKIGYLDLTQKPSVFNVNAKGINKVQRSNASDSYVNTLESQNSQLLDSGNEVISETLGFRDADNVFLKQTSNLKLHTAFPIYKVTKCVMNAPVTFNKAVYLRSTNVGEEGKWFPKLTIKAKNKDGSYITNAPSSDIATIILHYEGGSSKTTISNVSFEFLSPISAGTKGFEHKQTLSVPSFVVEKNATLEKEIALPSSVTFENEFYFKSTISDGIREEKQTIRICELSAIYELVQGAYNKEFQFSVTPIELGYMKADITPNVVENTKRQLLDTDFSTMPSASQNPSASDIAKWIYGTVGYAIGSDTIEGFSQTYERAQGWWSSSKTYIENLADYLLPANSNMYLAKEYFQDSTIKAWQAFLGGFDGDMRINPSGYYKNTFATFLFDVSYQPLNDLTLKSYKEETPLELCQLDGTAQGLTDMDRHSKNLQEKVNRLGNDVISINQTTDDESTLQPLNSLWEDDNAIVFRRTIAISKNYLQVTYNLSKDYVIKNYFTSITTKYRAYEHVDYKQSTLRKEHINVFAILDEEGHPNEEARLNLNGASASMFFKGFMPYESENPSKVRYALELGQDEQGLLQCVKYDVSVVTNDNSVAFVYQSWFNIGNGSYLKTLEPQNGGIAQSYQIWGDDYYSRRKVAYVNALPLYDNTKEGLLKLAQEPIVPSNSMDNALISVGNFDDKEYLVQFKDESERMNSTLQVTYVNKAKDLAFTEEMIRNMPYADNSQYGHANAIVVPKTLEQRKEYLNLQLKAYPNQEGILLATGEDDDIKVTDLVSIQGDTITFKTLYDLAKFDIPYKIVHAYKNANDEWEWVDIAVFGKLGEGNTKTYHMYLTDTNTQKIYSEDEYKVLRLTHKDNGNGDRGTKGL